MEIKLFKCEICGQIILVLEDTGVPLVCCGEDMTEIEPGTIDASREKHVPVIELSGDTAVVKVGSIPHPMTPEHRIEWVAVETNEGFRFRMLGTNASPEVCFKLGSDEKVHSAYAFCNLHGLWKA